MPVTSLKVARTMRKSKLEVLKYGERAKFSTDLRSEIAIHIRVSFESLHFETCCISH